jgi:hypothetical protein
MNSGRTVSAQLIQHLPYKQFHKCVARYRGDRYAKNFSCWDQYLAMAFAQLTYRESLRDIETCLGSVGSKLYHMRFRTSVARSTLADANEARDWRIYADELRPCSPLPRNPRHHPIRLATATAMTECVLLRISKAEMVRALHQEHALSDVFVSFLLTPNARVFFPVRGGDSYCQLILLHVKKRVGTVALLAQFGKENKPETVVPKISQEMLAEMIGTTRSRVSFL